MLHRSLAFDDILGKDGLFGCGLHIQMQVLWVAAVGKLRGGDDEGAACLRDGGRAVGVEAFAVWGHVVIPTVKVALGERHRAGASSGCNLSCWTW